MENKDIEKYISQLRELDKRINPDDVPDMELTDEFIETMDKVLLSLGKDIENDMKKTVEIVSTIPVRFMKLKPNAVTPSYAKDGDAGLDLSATDIISETGIQIAYGTGIAVEIPRGYVGLVVPRSSVRNYALSLANCIGIIDSGYRGEIVLTFNKKYLEVFGNTTYNVGDRIGQLIIIPYPQIQLIEAEELSSTERNTGGHGHTGS
jgi:dUTP pyrophosphatase